MLRGIVWQHRYRLMLGAILIWAGFLRLWQCDSAPPGLQMDEASDAWNAWCLLKTGHDEWGQRWPIFYTRAYDDYRSPIYLYLLMPFQAIGGVNVCTTRLPAAIGGVATVLLIYYIGRRLFDVPTGLLAAALLAMCPWHIQDTRLGLEACVGPLLAAATLAAILWTGAPCVDAPVRRRRAWAWLAAGLIAGLSCYGYSALRVFIPVSMFALLLATAPAWLNFAHERRSRPAIFVLLLGLAITIIPLAYEHLTDPHINARATESMIWNGAASPVEYFTRPLLRLAQHFNPAALFLPDEGIVSLLPPRGRGWLDWYMLPLLVLGALWLIMRGRVSLSARVLLAMLITYPAGDVLFGYLGAIHPLRCFPGVLALCLTAAVGAVNTLRWLASQRRGLACAGIATLAASAFVSNLSYVKTLFGPFHDDPRQYILRYVDLKEACDWLRPRLSKVDVVFCTQQMMYDPHPAMLSFLSYPPQQWFDDQREYATGLPPFPLKVVCTRFGKVRVMFKPDDARKALEELAGNGRRDHVVLMLRPGEKELAGGHEPALVIETCGAVSLLVYELDI